MVTFCPYTNRKSIRLTQANDMCYRSCCYFQQHHTYMQLFSLLSIEKPDHYTHIWRLSLLVSPNARVLSHTPKDRCKEKGMNWNRESINSVINTQANNRSITPPLFDGKNLQNERTRKKTKTTTATTNFILSLYITNHTLFGYEICMYYIWFDCRVAADVLSLARRFCLINEVQRWKCFQN